MPRRRRIEPREVQADPIYNSTMVEKFVCSMMWDGKKNTAQGIFYKSMDLLRERSGDDPLKLFKKAVENCKPLLEVKTRRVGGANYQVPIEVTQNRRTSLAIRWILLNARGRADKGMADNLMIEGAIIGSGGVLTIADCEAHERWTRLDAFDRCLSELRKTCAQHAE